MIGVCIGLAIFVLVIAGKLYQKYGLDGSQQEENTSSTKHK